MDSPVLSPVDASRVAGAIFVDLRKPEEFAAGHVPGAVRMDYSSLVRGEPPVGGLLPDDAALSALFSSIGLTSGQPVIAYDDDGNGRAGRLVWTLAAIGHGPAAILDGGFAAWRDAGLDVSTVDEAAVGASDYRAMAEQGTDAVAERDWILERLQDPGVSIIDTRSPAEYRGEDVRSARGGHIPGAVNFDWVQAMDPERHRALRDRDVLLAELAQLGVTPDKEAVTYCQTHQRSSHTFVTLRWLGFNRVRGYHGAWSDWGNQPDTPIEV
jgi:thiosulfate/3-mercaptopyruvate sulfurtransferase